MAGTVIACHTKDDFDAYMASKAYEAGKLVVIDFMSPDCGPCIAIAPVFAACAKDYPTQAVFLEVNIDEPEMEEEVASNYCVKGIIPTFAFIGDNDTLETFVGAFPDKLRNTIKEFIGAPESASSSAACLRRSSYTSNK